MQVIVNCKTKRIDYDNAGFRESFKRRFDAEKSFVANYTSDPKDASITITKVDDGEQFFFDKDHVQSIAFFLDNIRPYAEVVVDGEYTYSFVLAPENDNETLDIDGIFDFRESFDALAAAAGIEVDEHIDPNYLGLTPDGIDSMDALLDLRRSEGIEYDDDLNFIAAYDVTDPTAPNDGSEEYEDVPVDLTEAEEIEPETVDDSNDEMNEDESETTIDENINDISPTTEDEEIPFDGEDDITPEELDQIVGEDFDTYDPLDDTDTLDFMSGDEIDFTNANIAYDDADFTNIESDENNPEFEERDLDEILDNGSSILKEMQDQINQEKERRMSELRALTCETIHENIDDITIQGEMERDESLKKISENSNDAVNESNLSTENLKEQSSKLEDFATQFDTQMDSYNDILEQNHQADENFIAEVENSGDFNINTHNRLVSMLREQFANVDELSKRVQEEQSIKKKLVDELSTAQSTIAEQQSQLEEVHRRVKFSREQQKNNEKFVSDAKMSVRKALTEANNRIADALRSVDNMRTQVRESENAVTEAYAEAQDARENQAIAEKISETLNEKLEAERAYSAGLLEQFQSQMDAFADESARKLEEQVRRANDAQQKYVDCAKMASGLESDLASARNQVMQLGDQIQSKNREIDDMRKKIASTSEEYTDLNTRYEVQEQLLNETQEKLDKTSDALENAQNDNDDLREKLGKARSERERAIADKVNTISANEREKHEMIDRIKAECDEKIKAAETERDEMIDMAIAERDEKVTAAEAERDQKIAEMTDKMTSETTASEESRKKALEACENVINELSGIINNGMSSGFGNRKKKLDAIENALKQYLSDYESAKHLGTNDTELES